MTAGRLALRCVLFIVCQLHEGDVMGRNIAELNRALSVPIPETGYVPMSSFTKTLTRPLLLAALLAVMGLYLLRHVCASRLTTGHWWP